MEKLLSFKETAEYLGVSERSVRKLCNEGRLQFVEIVHGRRKITESQIQSFLEAQTRPLSMPPVDNKSIDRRAQSKISSNQGSKTKAKFSGTNQKEKVSLKEVRSICQS